MPIIASPRPQPALWIEDVGFATATWYAPDGTVWPLMAEDQGWRTLVEGISGLGAETITITSDKRIRGGVRVRSVRREQRVITWPLEVWSDESHVEFVQRWRAITNAFACTSELGPGWLEIARPDGTARRVAAYYQDGLEPKSGIGILSDSCVITLLCEDPYFQDSVPTTVTRSYATGHPFLSPFPKVSSASVLGATTIVNGGDVPAWPVWTLDGPAAGLTATLTATGESFTLTPSATPHGPLLLGEQATVRTDPAQIRGPAGEIWTGALNWPGAVLWSVPAGESAVTFSIAGASPGSAVRLQFNQRYRSA